VFYRRKLGEDTKHSSTHTSRLLGNPAACRGHITDLPAQADRVSPVESRSIAPQGERSGSSSLWPTTRFKSRGRYNLINFSMLLSATQSASLSVFWTYLPRFLVHLASLHLSLNGGILCLNLNFDGIFPYTGEVFRLGGVLCCPIKSKRS